MTEHMHQAGRSNPHIGDTDVEHLAHHALELLSDTSDTGSVATPFAQLFALTDAYLDIESQARHDILARILRRGITPRQVVDDVIPATARYLGKLWMEDRLSFADVSIGTARLQETVRAMTIRRPRVTDAQDAPTILLVVPRSEDHTLGIFVLAEQFRALECHVEVVIGSPPADILAMVRAKSYDLIGISCGSRKTLSEARALIKTLRSGVARRLEIAVGGAALDLDVDVRAATGANFVCTSAEKALQDAKLELPKLVATVNT